MEEDKGINERINQRVALLIAVLALVLAAAGLLGSDNDQAVLHHEMEAADTWAWFQAKNIRKSSTQLAHDQLALMTSAGTLAGGPQLAKWESEIERLRQDPEDGMDALMEKARAHEAARDLAIRRDPSYDLAQALCQLAIVLASVAIILKRPALVWSAGAAGVAGAFFLLRGLLL